MTCLAKINKGLEDEKAVQVLLIGTESKDIVILDPSGLKEKGRIGLPSVPVFIQTWG